MDSDMHSRVICSECGEVRIKTPSGACCPNGCGRLQPGVTVGELRDAERIKWAMTLPQFERVEGRKRIYRDAHWSEFVTARFGTSGTGVSPVYRVPVNAEAPTGCVLARDEQGYPRCFRPRAKQGA